MESFSLPSKKTNRTTSAKVSSHKGCHLCNVWTSLLARSKSSLDECCLTAKSKRQERRTVLLIGGVKNSSHANAAWIEWSVDNFSAMNSSEISCHWRSKKVSEGYSERQNTVKFWQLEAFPLIFSAVWECRPYPSRPNYDPPSQNKRLRFWTFLRWLRLTNEARKTPVCDLI